MAMFLGDAHLPHHDDWLLVQQCLPALHPQAGQRIQPQCFPKNAFTHVPQAHPQLHITNQFKPQSQATHSFQQCRDMKQHRGGYGLMGKVANFCSISLITKNECLTFFLSLELQKWRNHLFWCQQSWAEGVLNHY
jgi:hypothetical protein